MPAHIDRQPAEPLLVVQGLCQSFGFAKICQGSLKLAYRVQRVPKVEAEVNRLLQCPGRLRQVLQRCQRLLIVGSGVPIGGSRQCLRPRLAEVLHSLLPRLSGERMVREPFGMRDRVWVEPLHGLDDASMELAPSRSKDAVVGDVVSEGMLKGVLKVRKEFRLLEEFAGLEIGKAQSQPFLWQLGDLVEDRERNLVANDRGRLEQPLVLGREPIDTPC